MKMYPNDWRIRLSGAAGGMVGGVVALFVVKPLIELPVWQGAFAFVAMLSVGTVLGNIVGGRLFRPPCGGPTDHPPSA